MAFKCCPSLKQVIAFTLSSQMLLQSFAFADSREVIPANVVLAAATAHKQKNYKNALALLQHLETLLNKQLTLQTAPQPSCPPLAINDPKKKAAAISTGNGITTSTVTIETGCNDILNSLTAKDRADYMKTIEIIPQIEEYTDVRGPVQMEIDHAKDKLRTDAKNAKVTLPAKLDQATVTNVVENTQWQNYEAQQPTTLVAAATDSGPPEYRSILFNLSRSLTFRDIRTVRRTRAIDPTGFAGSNSMYGFNSYGGSSGFGVGAVGDLVIGAGVLGTDIDRETIEYMRRYDGLSLEKISSMYIKNTVRWAVPAGVFSDLYAILGPQAPELNFALGGSITPPGKIGNDPYNGSGGMGGGFGSGGLGGGFGSTLANIRQNIGEVSNFVKKNPVVLGDSVIVFLLYSNLALHLASLYDISLTKYELQVAFVLIYAIARTAITIKTKFPVTSERTYKKMLKSVARFFLALRKKGTKAQRHKEIHQALSEVKKAIAGKGTLADINHLAEKGLNVDKAEALTKQDLNNDHFALDINFKDDMLNASSPLNQPLFDDTAAPTGENTPGNGGQLPPPTPTDPNTPFPEPGHGGENPTQPPTDGKPGSGTPEPIKRYTFRQLFSMLRMGAFFGSLRFLEAEAFGKVTNDFFRSMYEERRSIDNQRFRTMLVDATGPQVIKLLAMAVNNGLDQPAVLDLNNVEVQPTDKPSQVFLKNQLRFIRNVARSARKCMPITEADQKKLESDVTKYGALELKQVAEAKQYMSCATRDLNLGLFSEPTATKQTFWQKIWPFKKAQGTLPYTQGAKCSDAQWKKFSTALSLAQQYRVKLADSEITLQMCYDRKSPGEYNTLRAELQTFNAIPLDADHIADLQEKEFENRLRIGELVIQVQMLDDNYSDSDYKFLTQVVLPALGLSNQIARQYFSRYKAFVDDMGLISYPWAPTGYKFQKIERADVYDWSQGYTPPFAPSSKVVDYLMNPRAPYQAPYSNQSGYGGLGGFGGSLGGYVPSF